MDIRYNVNLPPNRKVKTFSRQDNILKSLSLVCPRLRCIKMFTDLTVLIAGDTSLISDIEKTFRK